MERRLYRSRTDVMIGGVCGGLAQYLGTDSTLIRLVFVVLGFTGTGLLLYPAMWLIVPKEGQGEGSPSDTLKSGASEMVEQAGALGERLQGGSGDSNSRGRAFAGAALVLFGFVLLVQNLHIGWLRWINFDLVWPLLLILGGVMLIHRRIKTA